MRPCNLRPFVFTLFIFFNHLSLDYKDFFISTFSFIPSYTHTHRRCLPSVLCSMGCELICWSGTMSPQASLFNDKLCCCRRPAHRDVCWKHKGTAAEIGFVSISSILTSFAVPLQGLCGAELETEWNSEIGQWPWPCWMHSCVVYVCMHAHSVWQDEKKYCFLRIIGNHVGAWLVARETDLVLEWSLFFKIHFRPWLPSRIISVFQTVQRFRPQYTHSMV